MSGRKPRTAVEGAYCPVPTASLMAKRLVSGKYRLTELGLEMFCARCQTYWPADTEFFHASPGRHDGLYHWCKACYREWREERDDKAEVAA